MMNSYTAGSFNVSTQFQGNLSNIWLNISLKATNVNLMAPEWLQKGGDNRCVWLNLMKPGVLPTQTGFKLAATTLPLWMHCFGCTHPWEPHRCLTTVATVIQPVELYFVLRGWTRLWGTSNNMDLKPLYYAALLQDVVKNHQQIWQILFVKTFSVRHEV